jgi:hypothetical protein
MDRLVYSKVTSFFSKNKKPFGLCSMPVVMPVLVRYPGRSTGSSYRQYIISGHIKIKYSTDNGNFTHFLVT